MARVSIYVPDDMKARMDEVGEDRVNWSSVAQVAFRLAIINAALTREPKMEDVIERLKASKAVDDQRDHAQGVTEGREWAAKQATYRHLKTVANVDLSDAWNEDEYAEKVTEALGEGHEDFFGEEAAPGAYVKGFVEGARELWKAVASKV